MESKNINVTAGKSNRGKSITGMILTIVGLVLSWMGLCGGFPGFLTLVPCILGIVLAKDLPFRKIARGCGIAGAIISGVCIIVGFVFLGTGLSMLF